MRYRSLLVLPALLLLACANLKGVRDYAGESAKFAACTDLAERYRDTYIREQPYLDPSEDAAERALDARRRAAHASLVRIHAGLSAYMEALARIAGEDAYALSKDVDALSGALQEVPDLGISADQVKACADLAKITARWAAAARQQRAVRAMVEDGDPHVQTLVSAMQHLVRIYRKTGRDERARVLGVFEVNLPFTGESRDVLLNRLARAHLQAKTEEYRQADLRYGKAEKALEAMAQGHRKLRESLGDLSKEELRASLSQAAKDIKAIRADLKKGGE